MKQIRGLSQKCTDFLFKCLLDSPEITFYPLQSMTLGKIQVVPKYFQLIIAVLEINFRVFSSSVTIFYVFHCPEMMTLQL